ncbi:MAG: hypothetical protein EXR08_02005 [Alphaproteobacteria bacterium]|nr:hypothetical protein [Alphaproteobacteria bacterium]
MIDIEFKLNGRTVRPDQMANEIERAILTEFQEKIARKLRGIRDPETGAAPKITLKGLSLKNLSVEVTGSEALIKEVERRLS